MLPLGLVLAIAPLAQEQEPVSFQREVLPILSDRCFACHGPDEAARDSDLRLDLREHALADLGGYAAIVPGDVDASELIDRLTTEFASDRMPPVDSNLSLTADEIETLTRWVREGAVYEKHWAFVPPADPPFAGHSFPEWTRGPIDEYVMAKLDERGVRPNWDATPAELLRRLTLDLTGLPPTPEEYQAVLAEGKHWDYEAAVHRLLASPRYGERMAWEWLDAARYADTDGFQADPTRDMWPWRDWLVDQLNADTPFDQLTREMLAGDLLPDATPEQVLASGFQRNHMVNGEGGRIFEETRVENVFDRVETLGTVWLGMTFQCARCHDHKYDPISQREYYQLADFFNQTSDTGRGGGGRATPNMRYLGPEQRRRVQAIELEMADLRRQQTAPNPAWDAAQQAWEAEILARWAGQPALATPTSWSGSWWQTREVVGGSASTLFARVDPPEQGVDLSDSTTWVEAPDFAEGQAYSLSRDVGSTFLFRQIEAPTARQLTLSLGSDDAIKVWVNGAEVLANNVARGVAPDQERVTVSLQEGTNALLIKIVNTGGAAGVYLRRAEEQIDGLPLSVIADLQRAPQDRTAEQARRVQQAFRSRETAWQELRTQIDALAAERQRLRERAPQVMIMDTLPPERRRATRVLERGGYDQPTGEALTAGTPAFLPPITSRRAGAEQTDGPPPDRLDLAEWLVDPDHPLTARVIVNREWQRFFGRGLVATAGDFGRQGAAPTHPELLDYLARRFVEQGWSLKALHREILLSSTYRQSARFETELDADDPQNLGLRRAPRHRMPAWMLRDQALALAGVLNLEQGGPGVRPYQPEGVWAEATFDTIRYTQDQGEALYRRSLYVFWRRIVQPTFFFDTGKRQVCEVEAGRTNTPLHALVTLNETAFVEAARLFAERAWRAGEDVGERIDWAWFAATGRLPESEELATLAQRWQDVQRHYQAQPDEAEKLLSVGSKPRDQAFQAPDLAAMTVICSLILNLDEVLCRP